jgi:uncharacterized membrane protein
MTMIGGVLLLAVPPDMINHLVTMLTQGELSEDPHDFIASQLLSTAHGLTGTAVPYGALY